MNVKVYSSGALAYDNNLPEEKGYSMLSIRIQDKVNKGGTATLILPPKHRLRDGFPALNSLIEIYRDGKLRWRGRPLPHADDFYGRRTIVCEGELCFLNDASMRPYSLVGTPEEIFRAIIDVYNAAVDPWKRFAVGKVTVKSADVVQISSTLPEQVYSAVARLISQCSGYILFDSAENGTRQINWYADFPYTCNQQIRLGKNLLNYSTAASVTGFATRIIPYGAMDETGKRITIDVDGKDYVENLDAQKERGIIEKSVFYDGVTDMAELKALAEKDVLASGMIPETITLSAIDLSRMDVSLDAFAVGQMVPAGSEPHNLNGQYQLVSIDEDLVQSSVGSVTLTKDAQYFDGTGGKLSGTVSNQKTEMADIAKDLADAALNDYVAIVTKDLASLQSQIDGNITTWFGAYVPAVSNEPASTWATEEQKKQHLGDLYYIVENEDHGGLVYRWALVNGSYGWQLVEDTEVAKALQQASEAKDTADGKRRVFVAQPSPPYDVGDLWAQGGEGDLMLCQTARAAGSFSASDWVLASKYIDAAQAGNIAQGKVDAQTHEDIFNKLTKNGAIQGIYVQDGKWYINAELAKIVNLITEHLKTVSDFGTFEVVGDVLSMKQGSNIMVWISTEYEGYPVIYLTKYEGSTATARLESGPEGVHLVDLAGDVPTPRIGMEIADGKGVLVTDSVAPSGTGNCKWQYISSIGKTVLVQT